MYPFCFLNGKIIPIKKASLPLTDLAILRGYGAFEFFRTYNSLPVLIYDYFRRFRNTATELKLKISYTDEELVNIVLQLLKKNKISNYRLPLTTYHLPLTEVGIRFVLTGGCSLDSYSVSEPNFFILIEPLHGVSDKIYAKGVQLMSHEYQREFPGAKSINYLLAIGLTSLREKNKAYDTLFYSNNKILELTRSNFFIVSENTLITPIHNILHGITRNIIIKIAKQKYNVMERDVFMNELNNADECFMTSTTKKCLPVTKVDSLAIGNGKPGPVCTQLNRMFNEYIENKINEFRKKH